MWRVRFVAVALGAIAIGACNQGSPSAPGRVLTAPAVGTVLVMTGPTAVAPGGWPSSAHSCRRRAVRVPM